MSKVKSMKGMFGCCSSLEILPSNIEKWDTSQVTDMSNLFYACCSLKKLPDIS